MKNLTSCGKIADTIVQAGTEFRLVMLCLNKNILTMVITMKSQPNFLKLIVFLLLFIVSTHWAKIRGQGWVMIRLQYK